MDEETASTMAAVGPRLKGLRTQRNLSLTFLARSTGISLSTLSRLETGQRRPTLELLLPLARELRVDIGELIGAPQTGDPRLRLKPVTRHGMTMLPLTRRAGSLQAYKLIISPRMRSPEPEQPAMRATGTIRSALGFGPVVKRI
ncbi:helix-turn-helix domain-containing protein [Streptomyces sp. NPDC086080]|uniref:helix-turn-helix domain-containing protein n=1 Tax=Streptomyces sp. NPDC086080 TaxID=3365748 RepID=UPI0037D3D165